MLAGSARKLLMRGAATVVSTVTVAVAVTVPDDEVAVKV